MKVHEVNEGNRLPPPLNKICAVAGFAAKLCICDIYVSNVSVHRHTVCFCIYCLLVLLIFIIGKEDSKNVLTKNTLYAPLHSKYYF